MMLCSNKNIKSQHKIMMYNPTTMDIKRQKMASKADIEGQSNSNEMIINPQLTAHFTILVPFQI